MVEMGRGGGTEGPAMLVVMGMAVVVVVVVVVVVDEDAPPKRLRNVDSAIVNGNSGAA